MKHSIAVKFVAFVLCVCSLVAVAFSGTGIAFMEMYDLYHTPLETRQQEQIDSIGSFIAGYYAQRQAAATLSNAPQELLDNIYHSAYINHLYGQYAVDIYENGKLVCSEGATDLKTVWEYRETIAPNYPVVTSQYYLGINGEKIYEDIIYEETIPMPANWKPADGAREEPEDEASAKAADQEIVYSEEYHDAYRYSEELGYEYQTVYTLNYYEGPTYEVRVHLAENTLMGADFMLVSALYPYRDTFIPALLAGLVIFAICFVFLCSVAGRNQKGEIHLAAINRIPLDVYGLCLAGLIALMFLPVIWLFEMAYYQGSMGIWDNPELCILICCLCGFGIALCAIGFLYAFAAQIKASNNYWLRHTVIGWALGMVARGLRWIGRGFGITYRGCRAVVLMLPVIWQWLLTAFVMVAAVGFSLLMVAVCYGYAQLFWIMMFLASVAGCIAIVCYGGWCFGTLLMGAKTMSRGNLNHKINTKYLYGTFKDFGEQLNSLADAARIAAERQMKSERMKTELITNVSHDIKTPLTSIINYVDLMKKPHSEAEGEAYLEVLDRQSQRLKKLIDDLMEMSKASTGNLTVEIGQVDAVEAVNQALGEFADRLDRAHLIPVFRHPKESVMMAADGRLVWRVLSNLLSNAVKYALPDTRLYIDLMVLQGNAVIAIKNISREQLNVNADELMERFVRGDASRNTEGSGLGLNIAKSLVELQGGQMHLMVDGDLFKVTLIFKCS